MHFAPIKSGTDLRYFLKISDISLKSGVNCVNSFSHLLSCHIFQKALSAQEHFFQS